MKHYAIFRILYISYRKRLPFHILPNRLKRREKSISSCIIFPFYRCAPIFASLNDMGRVGHSSICPLLHGSV
ncbi:hypothetical protein E1A91_D06G230500v1 [Gossypium mustelinum]|uniref:Uncharacterized protein n=1 Tax=Gossypium mustelinum TaxID=34275 RepID=A0A5D2UMK8_GOSMU|nr:hypothetical protein E1A91_D06G230500v1 [Gossypium mustelinum]